MQRERRRDLLHAKKLQKTTGALSAEHQLASSMLARFPVNFHVENVCNQR